MNNIVDSVIEIPLGTKNKYEIDKEKGKIRLSRVQYSSMTYPSEYGFIDDTLAPDGDPVDILVITNGFGDPKIIAVNNVDPRCNFYNSLEELPPHSLLEIKNFFENYKLLQHIEVKVFDYNGIGDAMKIIEDGILRFTAKKGR